MSVFGNGGGVSLYRLLGRAQGRKQQLDRGIAYALGLNGPDMRPVEDARRRQEQAQVGQSLAAYNRFARQQEAAAQAQAFDAQNAREKEDRDRFDKWQMWAATQDREDARNAATVANSEAARKEAEERRKEAERARLMSPEAVAKRDEIARDTIRNKIAPALPGIFGDAAYAASFTPEEQEKRVQDWQDRVRRFEKDEREYDLRDNASDLAAEREDRIAAEAKAARERKERDEKQRESQRAANEAWRLFHQQKDAVGAWAAVSKEVDTDVLGGWAFKSPEEKRAEAANRYRARFFTDPPSSAPVPPAPSAAPAPGPVGGKTAAEVVAEALEGEGARPGMGGPGAPEAEGGAASPLAAPGSGFVPWEMSGASPEVSDGTLQPIPGPSPLQAPQGGRGGRGNPIGASQTHPYDVDGARTDDASPPGGALSRVEGGAYVEDSETGRRVDYSNVRNPTQLAVAALQSKHPAAQKLAISEMRANPEAFRARGIDVDAVLAAFGG